jgi:hypothetical protein
MHVLQMIALPSAVGILPVVLGRRHACSFRREGLRLERPECLCQSRARLANELFERALSETQQ